MVTFDTSYPADCVEVVEDLIVCGTYLNDSVRRGKIHLLDQDLVCLQSLEDASLFGAVLDLKVHP